MTGLIALLLLAASAPVPLPSAVATDKDYPDLARRQDVQGDVEYVLEIDATGVPKACSVKSSSGSSILDDATCRTVMRWRFQPARNDKGEAIAASFSDWMQYKLRDGTPVVADGYSVDVAFDTDGHVAACRVNRIVPMAAVTKDDLKRCSIMSDEAIFQAHLGRPTIGLQKASIRLYTLNDPNIGLKGNHDVERRLGAFQIGRSNRGTVRHCKTVMPAVAPVAAPGGDFCALEQFKVVEQGPAPTKLFIIDAVATVAH